MATHRRGRIVVSVTALLLVILVVPDLCAASASATSNGFRLITQSSADFPANVKPTVVARIAYRCGVFRVNSNAAAECLRLVVFDLRGRQVLDLSSQLTRDSDGYRATLPRSLQAGAPASATWIAVAHETDSKRRMQVRFLLTN
jgi:hypothetical protein